jgi:hypothetical protein
MRGGIHSPRRWQRRGHRRLDVGQDAGRHLQALQTRPLCQTGVNRMLVTAHAFTSSATWTPPSGMTEAVDKASQTGGGGIALEMNFVLQPSGGASRVAATAARRPRVRSEDPPVESRPATPWKGASPRGRAPFFVRKMVVGPRRPTRARIRLNRPAAAAGSRLAPAGSTHHDRRASCLRSEWAHQCAR